LANAAAAPAPSRCAEVRAAEREQSIMRMAITSAWMGYFFAAFAWQGAWGAPERAALVFCIPFWLAGFAHAAWVFRRPGINHARRIAALLLDFIPTTFTMALLGEEAAVLYYIYPWGVIGNGFRYGRGYLHLSQVLALGGFLTVVLVNPFWRQHRALSGALALLLVAVPFYVGVLISRVQTARRREEEARGEAEAANLAKTKFLAAASHDLRQPMQALSMYASVLGEDRPPADSRRIVQGIRLSVQALEAMFDGLLDIARLESGVVQASVVALPLMPLLERVVEAERPLAAHKGIELRVVRTSARVRSDPLLLERMLKNLVGNAIRYTERGRIVVGCRRAGPWRLRIAIADSGIGIPPHEQARIFEEYYQVEGASAQGLGLGLPIVRSLGELLGHRVAVKSAVGRGSTFSIELERAAHGETAEGARGESAAVAASERQDHLAGTRVALVDDDLEIRTSVSVLLQSWGCRCFAGATGAEVEERLRAEALAPHALIVDYRLAGTVDGLQVIERLRAAFGASLPALLVTGTPNAASLARRAADVSLAVKPVPPGKLRAFLAGSRA
jgi:signal transduction histidine kinase